MGAAAPPLRESPTLQARATRAERELLGLLSALPRDFDRLRAAWAVVTDRDALWSAAEFHGVDSCVRAAAHRAGIEWGTPVARHAAARRDGASALWQDVLRAALRSVLDALERGGIAAAVLKGPVLADRLYEDGALRPSTDLDVLVHPDSLDDAARALAPLGYVLEDGPAAVYFRRHHHHVHLLHATLPVLELHFAAYRGFGTVLPAAPLLARSTACSAPSWSGARVLSPEDELLYLAAHAAGHRLERFVWLLDLRLFLLRHAELDWELVGERARSHHLSRALSFTCETLFAWLDFAARPPPSLPSLGAARSSALRRLVRRHPVHVVDAGRDLAYAALLCDDAARLGALCQRFLRMKVAHEIPARARAAVRRTLPCRR